MDFFKGLLAALTSAGLTVLGCKLGDKLVDYAWDKKN